MEYLHTYRLPIALITALFLLILLPRQFFNTVIAISPLIIGFVGMTVAIENEWVADEDLALRYGIYGALALSLIILILNALLVLIGWHVFDFGGVIMSIIGVLLVVTIPAIIGVISAIFITPSINALINGGIGAGVLFAIAIVSALLNIPLCAPFALLIPPITAGYTVRTLTQSEPDAPPDFIIREGIVAGVVAGLMNCLITVIFMRFLLCVGVASCTDRFTLLWVIVAYVIIGLMIGLHIISAWLGAIMGRAFKQSL